MLFTVSLLSKLLKRLCYKKSHTLEEYILPNINLLICGHRLQRFKRIS